MRGAWAGSGLRLRSLPRRVAEYVGGGGVVYSTVIAQAGQLSAADLAQWGSWSGISPSLGFDFLNFSSIPAFPPSANTNTSGQVAMQIPQAVHASTFTVTLGMTYPSAGIFVKNRSLEFIYLACPRRAAGLGALSGLPIVKVSGVLPCWLWRGRLGCPAFFCRTGYLFPRVVPFWLV